MINSSAVEDKDPKEIRSLLIAKMCILKPSPAKSSIWQKFQIVYSNDHKKLPFAACSNCMAVYKHPTGATTTTLKRHRCASVPDSGQTTVTHYLAKEPPCDMKSKLIEKLSYMCAVDIRPFEMIEGRGFQDVLQYIADMAAKHGRIHINAILPNPTTVSRNVSSLSDNVRTGLRAILQHQFRSTNGKGGAFTCDLWTDDYKRASYFCMTFHYIDNRRLYDRVISTSLFPYDGKTGDHIKEMILTILESYSLNLSVLKSYVFVTDNGSNICCALKDGPRIACICHRLSTVLKTVFESKGMDEVNTFVHSVKEIVAYFKHTGLNANLSKTLKQECPTRWNSKYTMLCSFFEQQEEIKRLLQSKGELHRMRSIDLEVIENVIQFLMPFHETSLVLESTKKPSIHLVVPRLLKLTSHCQANVNDSQILATLKRLTLCTMSEKIEITKYHRMGTFLHPLMKKLELLDPDQRTATIDEVRKACASMTIVQEIHTNRPGFFQRSSDEDVGSGTKRRRRQQPDLIMDHSTSDEEEKDEVTKYIDSKRPTTADEGELDVIDFWFDHKSVYPKLFQLASFILAIPASSAASERDFSAAGNMVNEKRSNLDAMSIESMLLVKNNSDLAFGNSVLTAP
jgi:hypothetical protein